MDNGLKAVVPILIAGTIIFLGGVYVGALHDKETPIPPISEWSIEHSGQDVCINFSGLSSTTAAQIDSEQHPIKWYSQCDIMFVPQYQTLMFDFKQQLRDTRYYPNPLPLDEY